MKSGFIGASLSKTIVIKNDYTVTMLPLKVKAIGHTEKILPKLIDKRNSLNI